MYKLTSTLVVTLLCSLQLLAQTRTITGRVISDNGSPIQNALVMVKGSSITAATKGDGGFSLVVPFNSETLVISSAGFKSKELYITAGATSFNVSLTKLTDPVSSDVEISLDTGIIERVAEVTLDTAEIAFDEADVVFQDVVIVPYGTARRESLTGSVGQMNAAQFNNRPLTNITTAIEGNIPGVITTSTSGQPGSGPNIRVRGFGTINTNAEPLLVLDGVPYVGNISNINPADVESITVLKDPATTALYGSRAGNGVVMITTKKGGNGRNGISVRVMQGIVTRGLPEYARLDASQYYPIMWEAYRNSLVYPISGTGISLDSANRVASGLTSRPHIQNLLSYNPFNVANNAIVGSNGELNPGAQLLYADDLDWTNELFRRGARSDYSVNFNGGSEKSDYFLSLGYVKENTSD